MGARIRRRWAAPLLFAMAVQFIGPVHGVASALVGPVELRLPTAEPAAQGQEDIEGEPGGDELVAPQSHGCGEDSDPTALAECAGTAADCVTGGPANPADCATPLATAVTEAVPTEPPGGDPDPPCQEGEPEEQLACAVREVRGTFCTEGTDCTAVDLVLACLGAPEPCVAEHVVGSAADAVCEGVAPDDKEGCVDRLEACADAVSEGGTEACDQALDYLYERVRASSCDPESALCDPVTQVGGLLACRAADPEAAPSCGFRAVWDGATPTICELVGGEDCEATLDACDDPSQDGDCQEAAEYLQARVEANACEAEEVVCAVQDVADTCGTARDEACEGALYAVANAVCARGGPDSDCPPEPLPSMRDCVSWEGGAPTANARCVRDAVVAAICAVQGDPCVLEHPLVQALLAMPDHCGGGDVPACEMGLQDIVVAALCADAQLCFPIWAEEAALCEGPRDLDCHALALLHQVCADDACPPEVEALEACLQTPSPCTSPAFWTGWLADACVNRNGDPNGTGTNGNRDSNVCPEVAQVQPPRPLPDGSSAPQDVKNGSNAFPFRGIGEAVTAARNPAAQYPALDGRVHVAAGTYTETLSVPAGGREITILTTGTAKPVLDGGAGTALSLTKGHQLRITGGLRLAGAVPVSGPSVSASLDVLDPRVYVGRPGSIEISYANAHPTPAQTVATPEEVAVVVAIRGPSAMTPSDIQVQVDGVPVTLTDAAGTLETTVMSGMGGIGQVVFSGRRTVTLTVAAPGVYQVSARVVGSATTHVYASAGDHIQAGNAPPPATPPPGVPRTAEDDLPKAVRLSGEDRAATAASVSRSSFPDGASRAFVATGQSYADALAAGPAAARTGSPVVLVERDRVPEATQAEIERLRPDRVSLLGGTSAISAEVEAQIKALGPDVSRLRGDTRYATAAAVSQTHFDPGVPVAYVASGEGFADALSGGAAAAALGGPVLLVQPDAVPAATEEELRRLRPARLVVLGGRQAVSAGVESQLRAHADDVRRVSGPTRYATSAAVSRDAFPGTAETVFVATGAAFPDALAGVPAAGAERAPLLLVEPDRLPADVAAELDRLRPGQIVILGGERSVSQRLERELRSYQTR